MEIKDKSEAVAVRVFLRRRRQAWDHFFFLQDLKPGMFLSTKKDELLEILRVDDDIFPFNIVILCAEKTPKNNNKNTIHHYAFSIKAHEAGFTFLPRTSIYENSFAAGLKISLPGKVLYGS